jgi:hypothetical protein
MSEHEELVALLREIRDELRALNARQAGPSAVTPELLSLTQVDRLLRKQNGFAAREVAAGRLEPMALPGKRIRVARWQVELWQRHHGGIDTTTRRRNAA